MPTYDYECRACGTKLEIFHGINVPAKKKCPQCGKSRLERLIGAGSGFIFKGSGFYITDYRSSEYQAKAKADGGGSATDKPASGEAAAKAASPSEKSSGEKSPDKKSASDPPSSGAKPASSAKPAASAGGKKTKSD